MTRIGLAAAACAALLGMSVAAQAATLVEMKHGGGERSQMWVEADTARFEDPQSEVYMLMDLRDGTMYLVNDAEKQVMITGQGMSMPGATGKAPDLDAKLRKQGAGPDIAGYPTTHYVLEVKGNKCYDYYISKDAVTENDLGPFMERMSALGEMGEGMESMLNACELGARQISDRLSDLGLPMRTETAGGEVETEIVALEANADTQGRAFSPPEGYQVMDMSKMMQQYGKQQ